MTLNKRASFADRYCRRIRLASSISAISVFFVIWSFGGKREPLYGGQQIDWWLSWCPPTRGTPINSEQWWPGSQEEQFEFEARWPDAGWYIWQAGTNALPSILPRLAARSNFLRRYFDAARFKVTGKCRGEMEINRWQAVTALRFLHWEDRSVLLPTLQELSESDDVNVRAAARYLLNRTALPPAGPAGIPEDRTPAFTGDQPPKRRSHGSPGILGLPHKCSGRCARDQPMKGFKCLIHAHRAIRG